MLSSRRGAGNRNWLLIKATSEQQPLDRKTSSVAPHSRAGPRALSKKATTIRSGELPVSFRIEKALQAITITTTITITKRE